MPHFLYVIDPSPTQIYDLYKKLKDDNIMPNDIIIFAVLYLTKFGDRLRKTLFIRELDISNRSGVLVLFINLVRI